MIREPGEVQSEMRGVRGFRETRRPISILIHDEITYDVARHTTLTASFFFY